MEELDALLEELERSTLQDSDEYSNPASPPLSQHSKMDRSPGRNPKGPPVQGDRSSSTAKANKQHPFTEVDDKCVACAKHLSTFAITTEGSRDSHALKTRRYKDGEFEELASTSQVQLEHTTNTQEPNIHSEVQEPKESPAPPKTLAAAQLDELMAHLSDMQAEVAVKADISKKHVPGKQDHGVSLDSMLGGLEQDLQDLGIATVPKGHCASCRKPIAGKVIHALGQSWHPEHFVCTHCKEEVGFRPFFERSGVAYCPEDYHRLFSPRCAYCAAPIRDRVLTAMDQTWHPEHFFCSHCGEVFGPEGFHEKDKKPYCRKDFLAMFSPKCSGCSRPVLENYLSALDTVWHPECFVCGDCFSSFSTGSFFELDGRPFCELHYHHRRGTLCHGCGQPITGRCISAMGHKFHPEHFVCAFCLTQLNKGIFQEQNDKTYCQPCFNKLFSL